MALLEIELPEALLPQPKQIGQFIRPNQSICPECNRISKHRLRAGRKVSDQNLPEHGETEELYFGSYDMYQKSHLLERRKGNPCSERPNRELRHAQQLWSMLKPPQPH